MLITNNIHWAEECYIDRKKESLTYIATLGSLRKPRRQRQRERRETKGLMSRTIAVHVRYNSLYISLPSSTKQQREMTNSALSEERELRRLIF